VRAVGTFTPQNEKERSMLHLDSFPIDTTPHPAGQHPPVPDDAQVLSPEEVDIQLPRETVEQIAVPASINGRDLSQGQP
jgi:hypothetical protein